MRAERRRTEASAFRLAKRGIADLDGWTLSAFAAAPWRLTGGKAYTVSLDGKVTPCGGRRGWEVADVTFRAMGPEDAVLEDVVIHTPFGLYEVPMPYEVRLGGGDVTLSGLRVVVE